MINVALFVPIFFEIVSFDLGPCIPNVRVPLKQVTAGVALECIRYELILNQMLAHGLKRHIEPSIVSGPPAFHITWPAVRHVVKSEGLLLDLDGGTADRNFQFNYERRVGAPCFPYVRLQKSFFSPVLDCRPITIGEFS